MKSLFKNVGPVDPINQAYSIPEETELRRSNRLLEKSLPGRSKSESGLHKATKDKYLGKISEEDSKELTGLSKSFEKLEIGDDELLQRIEHLNEIAKGTGYCPEQQVSNKQEEQVDDNIEEVFVTKSEEVLENTNDHRKRITGNNYETQFANKYGSQDNYEGTKACKAIDSPPSGSLQSFKNYLEGIQEESKKLQPLIINMNDTIYTPKAFTGKSDEDAENWIADLKNFATYRHMSNDDLMCVTRMLLRGNAKIFFDKLPAEIKGNFPDFQEAFLKRYKEVMQING